MNFLFKIIIIKSFFTILILNNNLLAQNTKIIAKVGGEIVTSFELENKIKSIWEARDDNYSENRFRILEKTINVNQKTNPSMSYLGG